jgi:SAM-dependent methyltransferase
MNVAFNCQKMEKGMTKSGVYSDYDNFAWFYNRYWSDRLIGEIFWMVEKFFLKNLPVDGRILDLCCGNAHLSARMIERGFKVTGIDGSSEMLRYARVNCPDGEFFRCDAANIEFESAFDGVISTCDSLSHVMKLDTLNSIFANVYRALKPGGIFMFDLNNTDGFKKHWRGSGGKSEEDHAYIVKLSFDEALEQGYFEITMFRLIDGAWQRSYVKLSQHGYPHQSIIESLETCGFGKIDYYDCDKDLATGMTGRDLFIARK